MFGSNEKHTGKRRKERQITDSDAESVASEGAANPETDATAPETDAQQSETMSRVDRRKKRKKDNLGLNLLIGFLVVVLIGGLGLIAYPSVADWWNRMHQSYAVAGYVAKTNDMSKAEKKKLLDAAHAYNLKLAANSDRWHMTDEQKHEYNETLDVTGTGIMGYVTIPRIKVKLPIYHGTSDGVLQIAAGHLAGTSLPVGGATTHTVVSGHTGLPSARLLTGLDELQKGDTFAFHVLDETYTYQVDQISVVLPSEISKLNIESGADYATLITCTPYGVNSHRLLVRGHRIPNPKVPDSTQYDEPGEMTAVAAAVIGLIVFVAGCAFVGLARLWRRSWIVRHGLCAGAGARHSSGVRG
ncbi:class C sortase [Bifidobacterium adolescentis]|uniref:class C sortase n=1 Tax=Bifidobacterium adolescentis TaxID=1680 RepID=UPI003BB5AA25